MRPVPRIPSTRGEASSRQEVTVAVADADESAAAVSAKRAKDVGGPRSEPIPRLDLFRRSFATPLKKKIFNIP